MSVWLRIKLTTWNVHGTVTIKSVEGDLGTLKTKAPLSRHLSPSPIQFCSHISYTILQSPGPFLVPEMLSDAPVCCWALLLGCSLDDSECHRCLHFCFLYPGPSSLISGFRSLHLQIVNAIWWEANYIFLLK